MYVIYALSHKSNKNIWLAYAFAFAIIVAIWTNESIVFTCASLAQFVFSSLFFHVEIPISIAFDSKNENQFNVCPKRTHKETHRQHRQPFPCYKMKKKWNNFLLKFRIENSSIFEANCIACSSPKLHNIHALDLMTWYWFYNSVYFITSTMYRYT